MVSDTSCKMKALLMIMMVLASEGARVQTNVQSGASSRSKAAGDDAFIRVAQRVGNLMSSTRLQEQAIQAAEQANLLGDMAEELGGRADAFANELIWNSVETLMSDANFKVEARRLAIDFAAQMANPDFVQQVQELSKFIVDSDGKDSREMLAMSLAEVDASSDDSASNPKRLLGMLLAGLAAPAAAFQASARAAQAPQRGSAKMSADFDPLNLKGMGPKTLEKALPALVKAFPTPGAAASALTAAAVALHAQAASAKSVVGVNGALPQGMLGGDQPGGEGTGRSLGINDTSLGWVLFASVFSVGLVFNAWGGAQGDDGDFFDEYESRRAENSEA